MLSVQEADIGFQFDKSKKRKITVKIEVHQVNMGLIGKPQKLDLIEDVAKEFRVPIYGIQTVPKEQLIAGKLVASIARNLAKDTFDMFQMMKNKMSFESYRENIVYEIISSGTQIFKILNPSLNPIPKDWKEQIASLGNNHYDFSKHIKVRKEIKTQVNQMLTDIDRFYLLAHSIGMIRKTDCKFKDYPSVKYRSDIALRYCISHEQEHKNQIDELIKIFILYRPLDLKTNRLYDFFISSFFERNRKSQKNDSKIRKYNPFEDFFRKNFKPSILFRQRLKSMAYSI
ncbi:MAG: nucleotidyl transferase AbiEii/AbiGii toxin family protein [Flavobacteriaceae bacterium]|nr:nucleotidyl transferase AbiEii/AbiGii toxin family protein [Flavobacteriaceae bacterium]MCY4254279.1 nucleotidyl transferase AbiEii/AbiGii toxin family protein [Flavobacteriaceae bacterium]